MRKNIKKMTLAGYLVEYVDLEYLYQQATAEEEGGF